MPLYLVSERIKREKMGNKNKREKPYLESPLGDLAVL